MTPDSARNIDFVSAHELDGHGDGVQVMVHKGHAYVGHMFSDGFTVVDVRDPRHPQAGQLRRRAAQYARVSSADARRPAADGQLAEHLGHAGLFRPQRLLQGVDHRHLHQARKDVHRRAAGVRHLEPGRAARDRASCRSTGWACIASGMSAGAMPMPRAIGRALPTMSSRSSTCRTRPGPRWSGAGGCRACTQAGGEMPSWSGKRYALHHAIVAGNLAYAAWRDGGMTILDVADPTAPKLLSRTATGARPSAAARIRRCRCPTATSRSIADEGNLDDCANGIQRCWVFDVRDPTNPVSIATLPTPAEVDYCAKGAKFGPHNLHENRPGSLQSSELIFAHLPERRGAGVRHHATRSSRARSRISCRRRPSKMVDPRPEPAAGDPVQRRLCRAGRADVPDRRQCRADDPAVQGMTR